MNKIITLILISISIALYSQDEGIRMIDNKGTLKAINKVTKGAFLNGGNPTRNQHPLSGDIHLETKNNKVKSVKIFNGTAWETLGGKIDIDYYDELASTIPKNDIGYIVNNAGTQVYVKETRTKITPENTQGNLQSRTIATYTNEQKNGTPTEIKESITTFTKTGKTYVYTNEAGQEVTFTLGNGIKDVETITGQEIATIITKKGDQYPINETITSLDEKSHTMERKNISKYVSENGTPKYVKETVTTMTPVPPADNRLNNGWTIAKYQDEKQNNNNIRESLTKIIQESFDKDGNEVNINKDDNKEEIKVPNADGEGYTTVQKDTSHPIATYIDEHLNRKTIRETTTRIIQKEPANRDNDKLTIKKIKKEKPYEEEEIKYPSSRVISTYTNEEGENDKVSIRETLTRVVQNDHPHINHPIYQFRNRGIDKRSWGDVEYYPENYSDNNEPSRVRVVSAYPNNDIKTGPDGGAHLLLVECAGEVYIKNGEIKTGTRNSKDEFNFKVTRSERGRLRVEFVGRTVTDYVVNLSIYERWQKANGGNNIGIIHLLPTVRLISTDANGFDVSIQDSSGVEVWWLDSSDMTFDFTVFSYKK